MNKSNGKGNGNYGRIFIPINERAKPNIGKVYHDLLLEQTISDLIGAHEPAEDGRFHFLYDAKPRRSFEETSTRKCQPASSKLRYLQARDSFVKKR
jgi:hypothetical protein